MSYAAYPYRRPQQLGGLKKILRKAAGPVLAAGAIAAGQPQLAVAAYGAGKAATKKKPKIEAPVEPIPAPGPFSNLLPSDRNALLIGGTVVGTLVLGKLLFGGGGRRR